MRRFRMIGLLTAAILLVALASPAVYGQALTPTPGANGTATPFPNLALTPSSDSAPGQTGTNVSPGLGSDSAPGRIVTGSDQDQTVRRASDIMGSWVRSSDNFRLGRIDNLVVDPTSGDVRFALITTGGILGFREQVVPVPMSAFMYDLSADELILGIDAATFGQAPSMNRYSAITTSELGSNGQYSSFWSAYTGGRGASGTGSSTGTSGTTGAGTGTGTSGTATSEPFTSGTATSEPFASGTATSEPFTSGTATSEPFTTITPIATISLGADSNTTAVPISTPVPTTGSIKSGPLYTVTPMPTVQFNANGTSTAAPSSTPIAGAGGTTSTPLDTATPLPTISLGANGASTAAPNSTPVATGTTSAGAGTGTGSTGSTTPGAGIATSGLMQVGSAGSPSFTTGNLIRITELGNYSLTSCTAGTGSGIDSTGTMTGTGSTTGTGTSGTGIGSTGTMTGTTGTGTGTGIGSTGTMTGTTGTGTGTGIGSTGTMTGTSTGIGSTGTMTDTSGLVPSTATTYGMVEDALIDLRTARIVYLVLDVDRSGLYFGLGGVGSTGNESGTGIGSTGAMTGTGTSGTGIGSTGAMTGTGTSGTGIGSTGAMTGTGTSGTGIGSTENMTGTLGSGSTGAMGTGTSSTGEVGRLVLVPWRAFTADKSGSTLCFNLPTSALQNAPFSTGYQTPDTTRSGWDSDVNNFWDTQLGAGSTSGTGTSGSGIDSTGTMTGTGTTTGTGTSGTGIGSTGAITGTGTTTGTGTSGTGIGSTGAVTVTGTTTGTGTSGTGIGSTGAITGTGTTTGTTTGTGTSGTGIGSTGTMTGTGTTTGTGTSGTGIGSTGAITGTGTTTGTTGAATTSGGGNLGAQSGTVMQARRVMGTTVNDSSGNSLGEVGNLLIASDSGEVLYGVLSYGGLLGINANQVAIPWGAFRFDGTNNTFTVPTDQSALDAAPKITDLEGTGINQPGWASAVQQYWQGQGVTGANGTRGAGNTTTGTAGSAQLLRADRIIGMQVRGSDQSQVLGDVNDLLVNVDAGQVLYALVGYGGFLGMGETTKAVPWEATTFSAGDNTLVIANMTADQLHSAPDLSLGNLPQTVDQNWDANVQTFWQTHMSR